MNEWMSDMPIEWLNLALFSLLHAPCFQDNNNSKLLLRIRVLLYHIKLTYFLGLLDQKRVAVSMNSKSF